MAVALLLVSILLHAAGSHVCEESSSLLQVDHRQSQAPPKLYVTSAGSSAPNAVFLCSVPSPGDGGTKEDKCEDVTSGRGVTLRSPWSVKPLPDGGFLVLSRGTQFGPGTGPGSLVKCPEDQSQDCETLVPNLFESTGLLIDQAGNYIISHLITEGGGDGDGDGEFVEETETLLVQRCAPQTPTPPGGLQCTTFLSLSPGKGRTELSFTELDSLVLTGPNFSPIECTGEGTCTLNSQRVCSETPAPCKKLEGVPPGDFEGVKIVSGFWYFFERFNGITQPKPLWRCTTSEVRAPGGQCDANKVLLAGSTDKNNDPLYAGWSFDSVDDRIGTVADIAVEASGTLLVVDSFRRDRIQRIPQDGNPPPRTGEVLITGFDWPQNIALFTPAPPPPPTTTLAPVTAVEFERQANLRHKYCYDPVTQGSAAYRTFESLATQQECEDLCAADSNCNYYGWYTPKESRCDECVLYKSCEYQRASVCGDAGTPEIYKKTPSDGTNFAAKEYKIQSTLTDKYCKNDEIMAIEVATEEECKGNCSALSSCTFAAWYSQHPTSEPEEDAKQDTCEAQCRLFKSCNTPIRSLCRPGATIFKVQP